MSKGSSGMTVRALLTAVLLFAAAACGGATPEPEPVEEVTLTWWDYLDHSPTADQAVDSLVKRYQEAHPGVTIERTAIPRAEFAARLDEAAAAGSFPDIAVVDVAALPRLAERGAIADLTPRFSSWELRDRFLEPVRESVRHGDAFYGVPLRTRTTALLYNREVFKAAGVDGPPGTWDELRATAKALTTGDRFGLCFAAPAGDDLTTTFLPFLWQAGGAVADIGGAASVRALSYVDDLVNADRSAPADVLRWTSSDAEREFVAGRCAMMINGPGSIPAMNQAGLDWVSAPLPAGQAGSVAPLGGEAWALGRTGQHADRAWDVLRWLAEERDNATEFGASLSALPNRADTIDDLGWQWDPNVPAFAAQLSRARLAYGPNYPQVSEAIWTMAHQVLAGERSPADAAGDARTRLEPLLR